MKVSWISKKHWTIKWSDIKKTKKQQIWSWWDPLFMVPFQCIVFSNQNAISILTAIHNFNFILQYDKNQPAPSCVYLSLCSIYVLLLISIRYFLFFSGLSISSTRQPSFPFLSFSFPNAETDWQAWCERTKLFVVQHFIRQRSEDYGPSSREH